MDELERRILAHERALVEVAGHIDRAAIAAAIAAIREGLLPGETLPDEVAIRLQAIEHLKSALRLNDPPAAGLHWKSA